MKYLIRILLIFLTFCAPAFAQLDPELSQIRAKYLESATIENRKLLEQQLIQVLKKQSIHIDSPLLLEEENFECDSYLDFSGILKKLEPTKKDYALIQILEVIPSLCSQIEVLDLSGNLLTNFPEISQPAPVSTLILSKNKLTSESLVPLHQVFTGVSSLHLNLNPLGKLPNSIRNFTNLKSITLNSARLTDAGVLGDLGLDKVNLTDNKIHFLPGNLANYFLRKKKSEWEEKPISMAYGNSFEEHLQTRTVEIYLSFNELLLLVLKNNHLLSFNDLKLEDTTKEFHTNLESELEVTASFEATHYYDDDLGADPFRTSYPAVFRFGHLKEVHSVQAGTSKQVLFLTSADLKNIQALLNHGKIQSSEKKIAVLKPKTN